MKTWALILSAGAALLWLLLLGGDEPGRRALPEREVAPDPVAQRTAGPDSGTPEPGSGPARRAVIEGVIRGPDGPLWGAKVCAYRADGTPCGQEQSRFEGKFEVEIVGDDPVTLLVIPRNGTGLIPERRTDCAVHDLHEFDLRKGAAVKGTITRTDGKSVPRVKLSAVPREDYERTLAVNPLAIVYPSATARRCRVENDASFTLRGLISREYVLVANDPYWMLKEPVRFHPDARELRGVLVPAATLRVTCIDIETFEAVDPALALLPGGLVADAREGTIVAKFEVPPGTVPPVTAEIRAPGYQPREVRAGGDRIKRTFLYRERQPNVLLSVIYEDGRPVPVRHAYMLFNPDEKAMATESSNFRQLETGRFEGTLPAGKWKLSVFFAVHLSAEVEATIPDAGIAKLEIELKRGGDLVLCYPSPGQGLYYSLPVTVARLPAGGQTINWQLSIERESILNLVPGRYRVIWNLEGETVSREVEIERDRETVVDLSRP